MAGIAIVALAGLGVPGPESAQANEFTINACQADRGEFSTRAFEDFANRGMMWKRACDPEGPGLRGLVTANVVRAGRVVGGSRSYFVMKAPEGTRFARLTWSGQARRQDCRYALQVWADRPDGSSVAIKNVRANRGCPNQGKSQAAGWPAAHTYDIGGATKVVQRVLCVGSNETPYCSARGLNYIRTFKAQATVVDVSPPGVTITQDNAFTRGEWVNGTQQVDYAALDNVGVRVARAIVGGRAAGEHTRVCDYTQRIPCANGPGSITVDTSSLPDGSQPLSVQAEDAAANPGVAPATAVRVDNTAPGTVPVAVQGGERWQNQNDFDLTWTNPDEVDRAPISVVHYRLCPLSGGACVTDRREGGGVDRLADLAVASPGEWELRLWREDAATNEEPANASVPVALRYDPEPPQLGFEDPSPTDPTLISALITDKVSGLNGGEIELSRAGSGIWEVLPTRQENSRLIARIDDAHHPAGSYVLRATARDKAANQNSTDRRLDGRLMAIDLPLRVPTVVRAGLVRKRVAREPDRGNEKRRRNRPQAAALVRQSRVPLGGRVVVAGRVKTRLGVPIPGAEVQILGRSVALPERVVATFHTDGEGRFTYVTRAESTSVLRVLHPGTSTTLPSQREVTFLVPAASTIRPHPRSVLNGQAVAFVGQLRSMPAPAAGKLVELQVRLSGRWQTFRTVRTNSTGAWQVRYRFRRSCGVLRYRFRAQLPAEAGYPFETGHTHPVAVRVRGAPCR